MRYLVQYGEFNWSKVIEAESEYQAVEQLVSGKHVTLQDLDYSVVVFPIGSGASYRVSRDLKIAQA